MTESDTSFSFEPATRVLSRTLIAAGFSITSGRRQPRQIEVECERTDVLGATVRYLISLTDADQPPADEVEHIHEAARQDGRVLVMIARFGGDSWLGWNDFLDALGGAVPTWRALGADYRGILSATSKNQLPEGVSAEAWRLFEHAVADGFEFVLGRRVRRMGGVKPGQRVSDMITQTPDERVLVIDAKASGEPYGVTMADLRPLIEYVQVQKRRQQGHAQVGAAVLVANAFQQDEDRLKDRSNEFLSETGVPLACLQVAVLLEMVEHLSNRPQLRNSIRWARLFCKCGLVLAREFQEEAASAEEQRMPRSAFDGAMRRGPARECRTDSIEGS